MARVILLCNDVVGRRMAGPAIRYWELARQLARRHDVVLVTSGRSELEPDLPGLRMAALERESLSSLFADADVCMTQLVWPSVGLAARRYGVRLVLDSYDPILLEELEAHSGASLSGRRARNRRTLAKTRMSLLAADAVICANERQRDLWLGALLALDRLTPAEYSVDPSLRRLVQLVPFGLPDDPPLRNGPGLRDQLGLPPDAFLLVWGGGIWNWFDPLTLIAAVHRLLPTHPNLHLAFVGVRHPNEHVPEADMAARALALAEDLDVLGSNVHINHGWTPYDERQNNLLDADVGVSTHFDQLETRFAFRTRMLDYLWAGLPILATAGDSFAELIAMRDLGAVVPSTDVDALADALRSLIDDRERLDRAAANVRAVADDFRWSRVAEALEDTIAAVLARPSQRAFPAGALAAYVAASVREVVVERRMAEVRSRFVRRIRRRLSR
jgi:glycosyltransferase involved in cell wall biosynthesis